MVLQALEIVVQVSPGLVQQELAILVELSRYQRRLFLQRLVLLLVRAGIQVAIYTTAR